MTREMLKEERELRKWSIYINGEKNISRFFREIQQLSRAVREDDAKVAESMNAEFPHFAASDRRGDKIAAAIRGRK